MDKKQREHILKKIIQDKLPRITTRKGDDGFTDLPGGVRVQKNAVAIHLIGLMDEMNVMIGSAKIKKLIPFQSAECLQKDIQWISYQLVSMHRPESLPSPKGLYSRLKILKKINRMNGMHSLIGETGYFFSAYCRQYDVPQNLKQYFESLRSTLQAKIQKLRNISVITLILMMRRLNKMDPQMGIPLALLQKISLGEPLTKINLNSFEKHYAVMAKDLPACRAFLLPGSNPLCVQYDFARVKVREYERKTVFSHPLTRSFINRLSDYLFCRVMQSRCK